jgi:uncharacterized protein (TIGR03435 family)
MSKPLRILRAVGIPALAVCVPLAVGQKQTPPLSAQTTIATEPQWQIAAGGKRSFDVVSIHPAKPGEFTPPTFALDSGDIWFSGKDAGAGLLVADFPVWVYIAFAYKLWLPASERKAMLAHLPSWVENENIEIRARAPGNSSKDQVRLMMQSMLADRFKLAIHFESHEGPVLTLSPIHPGKLGDKLRRHAEGPPCDVPPPPRTEGLAAMGPDLTPPMCGVFMLVERHKNMVITGARDITLNQMAGYLSVASRPEAPIVNQTGLDGRYDFSIEWTPDFGQGGDTEPDLERTTFKEAVKEQLGLKLTPAKGPVTVPVIDHIEKPSEN